MSWKMISKPKVVSPNRQIINEFADMEPAPGDRQHKGWRAARIRQAVMDGTFRGCTWASVYCHETKTLYRPNGKHTSKLFQSMNGDLDPYFNIIIERYECDTLADVASLYKTFDTRDSVRQICDINRSVAATIPEIEDVKDAVVNLVVASFSILESISPDVPALEVVVRQSSDSSERAEKMRGEVKFIRWLADLLGSKTNDSKQVWRAPVVAAIHITFCRSQKASVEFWSAVRDGSGEVGSPQRKLHQYLRDTALGSAQKKQSCGVDRREMLVKCIHAWNAWRKGDSTALKYYPNSPVPPAM